MARGKILVIESDGTRAQATEMILSRFGHYEVSLVSSGLQALQKIGSEKHDLVLINPLFTKDESGLTLTRLILLKRHPVMIVTHAGSRDLVRRFAQAGILDFILFPWNPANLLQRIAKVLQARQSLDTSDLNKQIEATLSKVLDLPTISPVYEKVREVTNKPDASAEEIAEVLGLDQSITTKLLRLANSAYFGFTRRITSTQDAVSLIGLKAIQSVVLTVSTFEAMNKIKPSEFFDRMSFWEHSIACGAAAKIIARNLKMDEGESFSLGILHDVGKVVLDGFFADYFDQAIQAAIKKDIPLFEAERETLGITHGEVGSHLIKRWNLPEIFTEVTRGHNSLFVEDKQYAKATALIHVANILCRTLQVGTSGDTWSEPEALPSAFRDLKIGQKATDEWMPDITKEIENGRTLLAFAQT